jgi:hypothetical protein
VCQGGEGEGVLASRPALRRCLFASLRASGKGAGVGACVAVVCWREQRRDIVVLVLLSKSSVAVMLMCVVASRSLDAL